MFILYLMLASMLFIDVFMGHVLFTSVVAWSNPVTYLYRSVRFFYSTPKIESGENLKSTSNGCICDVDQSDFLVSIEGYAHRAVRCGLQLQTRRASFSCNLASSRKKGNQHLVSKSCNNLLVGEFYQLHRKLSGDKQLVAIQLKFHKY